MTSRFRATLRQYLFPAVVTIAVFGACATLVSRGPVPERLVSEDFVDPFLRGACLVVVLEPDAAYIGEDRIPYDGFEAVLNGVYRKQNLAGAFIYSTGDTRYGDFVQVYAHLTALYGARLDVCTLPIGPDVRFRAIYLTSGRPGWGDEEPWVDVDALVASGARDQRL